MKPKMLYKIANISGWLLLVMLILYFISGYAMVHKYGMEGLMNASHAKNWHTYLALPFLIFLFLHIVPYYVVRKQVKKLLITFLVVFSLPVLGVFAINKFQPKEVKPPAVTKEQENKAVQCDKCPKGCIIKPGERGECGRVENIDGKLYTK